MSRCRVRVELRPPSIEMEREFLAAANRSRSLLRGWADPPRTRHAFRAYIRRLCAPTHRGHFVVLKGSGELVGVVNLSEIVRGSFQSAYLGCYGFVPHVGQGLMGEALMLVLARAFGELRLHRVEANIQPANARSIAFFSRLGFRREGYSPRYLKIAGSCRDHERWAMLAEEWRARKRPAHSRD